ncbi:uncharacterized protein LOC121179686 [Toxotes jaculatrix]|uniref:uncharacterized protein LOC121179686 n=1 Tax=Toxotes jaculatrix TaxID=941984 RepID=UPI001B3AA283|nr:uncharacterized protein LOC121179686 [Toxotes jaculatrix]XP_040890577.1 uncharacterized protein LOC121179686 [Toxotes jaculatrix]XP_040890578.1 uncharacterized protein LOC121179686 [Toxotes jaculatrix]
MDMQTEKQRPSNGQLISVPHKDTVRLLEVYVKRSLSLNDGTLGNKSGERKEKWVIKKQRRHSSDPSLHLAEGINNSPADIVPEVEPPTNQPETRPKESEKPTKKTKKNKKPSFWKNVFGFFSRKSNEDKDETDGPSEMPTNPTEEEVSDAATTCLPTAPVPSQKKKTMRKKSLRRKLSRGLSLRKPNKLGKDLNPADITEFEAVVSVEPTYSYYEKVSEELEKIVHEVKVKEEVPLLSDDEVINRIIALTKEQGDAIEDKLKDNPTLNNFFQRMSYSSFQKLADAYLEKEATPIHSPPTVLPTAPELVKLAFTLDFTARIAGLSRQNIGHITGLGNRYLQDRFEYKQACTDHPWSDCDD